MHFDIMLKIAEDGFLTNSQCGAKKNALKYSDIILSIVQSQCRKRNLPIFHWSSFISCNFLFIMLMEIIGALLGLENKEPINLMRFWCLFVSKKMPNNAVNICDVTKLDSTHCFDQQPEQLAKCSFVMSLAFTTLFCFLAETNIKIAQDLPRCPTPLFWSW